MHRVALERGTKRVFAIALDLVGLARVARSDEGALEALTAYVPRWEAATGRRVPDRSWVVVEELRGSATTDFGAPDALAVADSEPWRDVAEDHVGVLRASWAALDRVSATAPAVLRKGPRGGGRDTAAVVAHVLAAEHSYSRMLGLRHPAPDPLDHPAVAAARDAVAAALVQLDGPVQRPRGGPGWPPRYAVRRMAWHVLDHVWEVEDRSAVG